MSRYSELTEAQKQGRRDAVRRYRERNSDNESHKARKRDYDRKYLYGLTMEEIAGHQAAQGGKCKICEASLYMANLGQRKREGKPHVDHCHTTGAFRGALCTNCNIGIGMFRDNPVALANAIIYLN